MVLKKNSLDLKDVKPECKHIRDRLVSVQKEIDNLKPIYDEYNKKLMLSKKQALDKAEIGTDLFQLNIKAVHLIHDLAMCQEGRSMEMI